MPSNGEGEEVAEQGAGTCHQYQQQEGRAVAGGGEDRGGDEDRLAGHRREHAVDGCEHEDEEQPGGGAQLPIGGYSVNPLQQAAGRWFSPRTYPGLGPEVVRAVRARQKLREPRRSGAEPGMPPCPPITFMR